MTDKIRTARDGGIVTITIDDPAHRNAIGQAEILELATRMEALAVDPSVRVVVLTGSGDAFCSGANLDSDPAAIGRSAHATTTLAGMGRIVRAMTDAPFPVIAAVRGVAAGGGASLALAADLVIAGESAFFLLPFLRVGLVPDGGATLVVAAAIGRARALRLALRGERLPAREAYDLGLIAAVCEDAEVAATAAEWAEDLARGPRTAIALTKKAINTAALDGLGDALVREGEYQVRLAGDPDFREGVAAFKERRRPRFAE
ncbi:enoyl-CoA hydratase/carnithine racemase [Microbacterium resistens]|uniref:Enoyl-CoA hydratase/carnithine racemase n=1 Tax=Microbacterium resistens TaxID=156977 RepID=A0ABU1SFI4_9MICO|nr:enoyl-CoA hydratase-related protein [Microbacterium resistens]MDR6868350.1 enoyl-CoA hydratase/carnithine racemase [Microbacterium resistens]